MGNIQLLVSNFRPALDSVPPGDHNRDMNKTTCPFCNVTHTFNCPVEVRLNNSNKPKGK